MSACGYEFICLNWIISLKVQKMSWTLDGKIRNNARLSNTSFIRVCYWTSVSLRRLYIGQFPPLHFKDRDEGFVSKGSKDILHENKIFSCTLELPNKSAVSLWFLFCLFCYHLGRICDLYFRQKYWKSFYSWDNNILFGYNIIRGIQQATSIYFFPFVGYQSGNQNKTHFALLGSRSENRFAARSRVLPKHKIGPQCVHVWLTKLSCFLVSGVSLGFY